ncbi:uncharacterized protein L201_006230 [Kwoniella dendrophila CBS 6074]|uniref:SAP domain-containing protein n=1 Tax=Kwoniella dendrophila CBS 6074 TaxID=1295534 RepID=A0AAX4K337_9TREE
MADEILRNSAALNALKRHQLVSLSKRYGLKASGKNVEMISRLEDYAVSHANDLDFYIPSPAPTPGPNMLSQETPSSDPPTPLASHTAHPLNATSLNSLAPIPLKYKDSMASMQSRTSEAWEVLSESGASLVSPKKPSYGLTKTCSWKSANNGEAMAEFGGHHNEKASSTSSMKALASSLTRRGSRILLGRSTSASSQLSNLAVEAELEPEQEQEQEQEIEEVTETIPPSPASTVGVPRRYSRMTLQERPSTVRLCSPTPTSPRIGLSSDQEEDELPFFGKANLKERRSMAPLRSSLGSTTALAQNGLSRKSMPALPSSNSAHLSSIYPPLPTIPPRFAKMSSPKPVPGGFPPLPPTPSQMVFGSRNDAGVSNQQFSETAQAVLKEMNAKLPGGVAFGEELLKGKKAEMDKLVQVNKELGTGGWGLSNSTSEKDRYASAHQKEFAKMRSISKSSIPPQAGSSRQASSASITKISTAPSATVQTKRKHGLTTSTSTTHLIPSAPNGAPLVPAESHDEERQAKRKRLSNGPNYLGSIREAGRSIANLLGEEKGKSTEEMMKAMKDRRDKRRSSLIKRKGRGISSRFGFLRSKKTSTLPSTTLTDPVSSVQSPPVPAPTMPRKTSVYAPKDPPHGKIPFDLEASLARKPTTSRRRSTDLSNVIKPNPEVLEPSYVTGKPAKDRGRSTSVQTMLSQSSSSSRTPRRAKIPDFAPPGGTNRSVSSSTNTLGLPKSSSLSSNLAMSKKASQVEIIRNARPAPAPPSAYTDTARTASGSTRPVSVHRTSTLYQPTASSLARMQATVRPNPERPLPMLPPPVPAHAHVHVHAQAQAQAQVHVQPSTPKMTTTVQPFGSAQSRDNQSFSSNFNLPKPRPSHMTTTLKSKTSQPGMGGVGKPQSSSAARIRARQSGLSAVKSKNNLKEEMEVRRKRSEIKARMERREEERELREMLGGI